MAGKGVIAAETSKVGQQNRRFYGWTLVGVGFLVYGFGIGPGYYSWGFFAPEVIAELGLSREQIGEIFGAFTLTLAVVSPLAAWAIQRWGLRVTVTAGALLAALGFWLLSRADSVLELYLSYSLLGGVGIGLSTVLPAQTLSVFWFRKYRARATAIILLGAAVVGGLVTPVDDLILRYWDWRVAWVMIAGVSVLVAVIAALFLRNRPEELGQLPDGRRPDEAPDEEEEPAPSSSLRAGVEEPAAGKWTAAQAIRTPQFLMATFAGMANTVPWRVLTAHGRLHFEDLGFTPTVAAAILGVRVGVSAVGRLSGSLGDFLRPTRVMAVALVVNGLGLGGLVFAETAPLAYFCVVLLGVGYGAAYISIPVVFAHLFGRPAFVGTAGVRITVVGVVSWLGPSWAGAAADRTGSYAGTLVVLMAICLLGAAAIFLCRRPELGVRSSA